MAAGALPARAEYPDHLVKLLVPIPPGGAPDLVARLVAQSMSESFGQAVVVENRPGANGNLAAEAVAKAPPDGYTLLSGADSGIVINPHVYAKLGFDPLKDLVPVASVATNQFILAVNPKVPVHSLAGIHRLCAQGQSAARLCLGRRRQPAAFRHGGAQAPRRHQPAARALSRRHAVGDGDHRRARPRCCSPAHRAPGQFEAGNLRPLAASGKARSKRFPDLPTIGEFYPGYEVDIWLGVFAPVGTPEPVMRRIREAVHGALRRPDVAEKLNVTGSLEPLILDPPAFAALIRRDYDRYGALVKQFDIRLD